MNKLIKLTLTAVIAIIAITITTINNAAAQGYMFVRSGEIKSIQPRDIPAVGVRLDDNTLVLGLPSASTAVQEACGWYKVQPWSGLVGKDQIAGESTYSFNGTKVIESRTVLNKVVITPEARLASVLNSMPGKDDNERVSAFVQAIASTITNKFSQAITVTIPAESKGLGGIGDIGIGGK